MCAAGVSSEAWFFSHDSSVGESGDFCVNSGSLGDEVRSKLESMLLEVSGSSVLVESKMGGDFAVKASSGSGLGHGDGSKYGVGMDSGW